MRLLIFGAMLGCGDSSPGAPTPAAPPAAAARTPAQRDPAPSRAEPVAPAPVAPTPLPGSPDAALSAYYAAIDAGNYRAAYRQWEGDGSASGKTLQAFAAGFAETVHSRVVLGTPGPLEGAAGSVYVAVPVEVFATLKDGTAQHFTGSYELRRPTAPGPGGAPSPWHLHSAELRAVR